MLDLIDENDEKGFFDSAFTPPLWLYADGIKLGCFDFMIWQIQKNEIFHQN
ncbi:hypothetical protein [Campylobacter jejuni]|uniref:hypothetical protein n=1 Tax=Campylobacter jejuni TaxID=197 RepID=UPI003A884BD9